MPELAPTDKTVLAATAGLALVGVGIWLPWSRIGGRARSGLDTADTFIGLADGLLPDTIAWVGRWWYLPLALLLIAWATVFARSTPMRRALVLVLAVAAVAMWWLFVWAANHWGVVTVRLPGPIIATVGAVVLAGAALRSGHPLLHQSEGTTPLGRPD